MRVLVHHAGQQQGPFSLEEVRQALADGRFQPADLAWHEGLTAWVPLSSIVEPAPVASDAYPVATPTSGLALASLILGICSAVFCILTGIPAVVCGHLARTEIRRAGGRLTGDGMAIAGLVLGYCSVGLLVLGALVVLFFAGAVGLSVPDKLHVHHQGAVPQYIANATTQVFRACKSFAADHGGSFPETLEELVPFYLADRQLLACPLSPQDEVGYFYFGGKESDNASDTLLMSKGTDEQGERVVVLKNGSAQRLRIAAPSELH